MHHLETEVKFVLNDLATFRKTLTEYGAVSQGEVFEKNLRLDNCQRSVTSNGALLRLRRDNRNILTFKAKPAEEDRDVKAFNETEVEVSDFDSMRLILEGIGFECFQIYEKYRETLHKDDILFCIDRMPFGVFLEIEGPKPRIIETAANLKFDWTKRILVSYGEIFETITKEYSLLFTDITFENFSGTDIDLQKIASLIEAG